MFPSKLKALLDEGNNGLASDRAAQGDSAA
jgi:hypothetical protein